MKTALRLASATAVATLLTFAPVSAQEGQRVVDDLTKRAATVGTKVDVGSVDERGDNSFTLNDVAVTFKTNRTVTVDSVVADNHKRTEDGLTADKITVNGATAEFDKGVVATLDTLTVNNLDFPDQSTVTVDELMQVYTTATARDIAMSVAGQSVMTIASVESEVTKPTDTQSRTQFNVSGFVYDVTNLPDSNAKAQIVAMGYPQITGSMTIDGVYDVDAGVVDITDMTMVADNAATLSMNYSVGGYTREFAEKIQQINAKHAANPGSEEATRELLPLMSGLTLRSATIKVTDASLTGKLLELQSKSMGSTPTQLAEMAPMFITMGMQGLQMPELSAEVAKAAGDFLKNQGSLTISVAPDAPVPFSQIAIASQVNPRSLPELLNVSIVGQ